MTVLCLAWARRAVVAALAAAALLAALLAAPSPGLAQKGDPTVSFSPEDREMNAAIDAARASFPTFIDLIGRHPDGEFFLKVAIAHPNGREHIWMSLVDFQDGRFVGSIVNQGVEIPYGPGDEYRASWEEITDWMVHVPPAGSGPIHGAYTLRVIERVQPGSLPSDFIARLQPLP